MNVHIFAAKKTQGVVFRVGKPALHRDLGIQKLVGSAKDEFVMKLYQACRNALAPV